MGMTAVEKLEKFYKMVAPHLKGHHIAQLLFLEALAEIKNEPIITAIQGRSEYDPIIKHFAGSEDSTGQHGEIEVQSGNKWDEPVIKHFQS